MEALFVFLSHLVLFLSLTTLVFAFGAYACFMLRRRRPLLKPQTAVVADEVALLRRYMGPDHD